MFYYIGTPGALFRFKSKCGFLMSDRHKNTTNRLIIMYNSTNAMVVLLLVKTSLRLSNWRPGIPQHPALFSTCHPPHYGVCACTNRLRWYSSGRSQILAHKKVDEKLHFLSVHRRFVFHMSQTWMLHIDNILSANSTRLCTKCSKHFYWWKMCMWKKYLTCAKLVKVALHSEITPKYVDNHAQMARSGQR